MSENTIDGNDSVFRIRATGSGGIAIDGKYGVYTTKLLTAIDPDGNDSVARFLTTIEGNDSVAINASNSIMLLTIYKKCLEIYEGVAEICIKVKTDEVCAEVKLLNLKLAEGCAEYDAKDNTGKAELNFGTINTGIWKLESILIQVEQNFDTGNGRVTFSGNLYQLTIQGYKKRRKWDDEELSRW